MLFTKKKQTTKAKKLTRPTERVQVALAALAVRAAQALERERLGDRLARAAHAAARVDAQQDGAAVGGGAHLAVFLFVWFGCLVVLAAAVV